MPTHVIIEQFTSRVLADNPLGDPATRSLPIILPPDYEVERQTLSGDLRPDRLHGQRADVELRGVAAQLAAADRSLDG